LTINSQPEAVASITFLLQRGDGKNVKNAYFICVLNVNPNTIPTFVNPPAKEKIYFFTHLFFGIGWVRYWIHDYFARR
jgi:hypothetical protein